MTILRYYIRMAEEESQHPAVMGIATCLCWMDVLCPGLKDMNHLECWEHGLVSSTDKATNSSTLLASQGCKNVISELVQSIHGKILDTVGNGGSVHPAANRVDTAGSCCPCCCHSSFATTSAATVPWHWNPRMDYRCISNSILYCIIYRL